MVLDSGCYNVFYSRYVPPPFPFSLMSTPHRLRWISGRLVGLSDLYQCCIWKWNECSSPLITKAQVLQKSLARFQLVVDCKFTSPGPVPVIFRIPLSSELALYAFWILISPVIRYTASAQLCPPKHRAIVGWVVGWLNILGMSYCGYIFLIDLDEGLILFWF